MYVWQQKHIYGSAQWYLHCLHTRDTTVLHWAIAIMVKSLKNPLCITGPLCRNTTSRVALLHIEPIHYSDVTWLSWHLSKPLDTWLFFQHIVQAGIKEHIKVLYYQAFVREIPQVNCGFPPIMTSNVKPFPYNDVFYVMTLSPMKLISNSWANSKLTMKK